MGFKEKIKQALENLRAEAGDDRDDRWKEQRIHHRQCMVRT